MATADGTDPDPSSAPANRGPLAGARVVELAHIMAGPVCGLMLADMGADVIKVEKWDGDDTRRFVPPTINDESAAFLMMNRNKRGIVLDLKSTGGKAVLRNLLRTADVLVENYRHDTMARLGLDYETLKRDNPGLIYCEVSGFGRTGPYAHRGGFDLIAQGMSGLMSITGEGPGRPPVKVGAPVSDITAGILAAMGVCAAYAHKLQTGEGQRVDTSLFEAAITHTYWQSAIAFATGVAPQAMGSAHPLNAPYEAFEASDGYVNIGAANQKNWERLVAILEAPELLDDARFATNAERITNREALAELINARVRQRPVADWLDKLEAAGVPAGPVLSVNEMHNDPQTRAREMVVETDHPTAGPVKSIGLPVKFSATPGGVRRPAPRLGEHTREILRDLGYGSEDIAQLTRSGAVRALDEAA